MIFHYFFFAAVGVQSIAISVSVCLSVSLFVSPLAYLKNTPPNFTKFSVHVTCGRGSILL